jgi:hypothetical protein
MELMSVWDKMPSVSARISTMGIENCAPSIKLIVSASTLLSANSWDGEDDDNDRFETRMLDEDMDLDLMDGDRKASTWVNVDEKQMISIGSTRMDRRKDDASLGLGIAFCMDGVWFILDPEL